MDCVIEDNSTKTYCSKVQEKFVRVFLRRQGIKEHIISELFETGLTDEAMTKLESEGLSYKDIVVVNNAFKKIILKSDNICDCSFNSESSIPSRKTNEDSDYLSEHFGTILPTVLREISMKKPFDPIEYLGQWLLHYRDCEERNRRRKEFELELLEERLKLQKPVVITDTSEEYEFEDGEKDDEPPRDECIFPEP